MAVMAAREMPL
jgi:hypothetical protein